MAEYVNAGKQRLMKVFWCLSGFEINGATPKEIIEQYAELYAEKITNTQVTVEVENLIAADAVERITTNPPRYRLTPKLITVCEKAQQAFIKQQEHLDRLKQRYSFKG